jgi:hypothetical protein
MHHSNSEDLLMSNESQTDLEGTVKQLYRMVVVLLIVVTGLATVTAILAIRVVNSEPAPRDEKIRTRNEIADQDGVITARGFVLVDEQGEVRADLGLAGEEEQFARLRLFDPNGYVRVVAMNSPHGGTFGLFDEHGNPRAALGEQVMVFTDKNRAEQVTLGIPNGMPGLVMNSLLGHNNINILCRDDFSTVSLSRKSVGTEGDALLHIDEEGKASVNLSSGRTPKNEVAMGVDRDAAPFLVTMDAAGDVQKQVLP